MVPLATRKAMGIVLRATSRVAPGIEVREILRVLDPEPVLPVPESFGRTTKYRPAMITRTATTATTDFVFPGDACGRGGVGSRDSGGSEGRGKGGGGTSGAGGALASGDARGELGGSGGALGCRGDGGGGGGGTPAISTGAPQDSQNFAPGAVSFPQDRQNGIQCQYS